MAVQTTSSRANELMNSGASQNPPGGPSVSVETVVTTREREPVEGFKVWRVLPSARRRMVGPFVFLDQIGPEVLGGGCGLDVAPHPHIGLASVTYLFAGELLHCDNLGTAQTITPGAVNWMTSRKDSNPTLVAASVSRSSSAATSNPLAAHYRKGSQ